MSRVPELLLTRGLLQKNPTHGAIGREVVVASGTQVWLVYERLEVGPGVGGMLLAWARHRLLQCPQKAPLRTGRWKSLTLGENDPSMSLVPVSESYLMLVFRSESCFGPSLFPVWFRRSFLSTLDPGFHC